MYYTSVTIQFIIMRFALNNLLQNLTHWGRVTHICVSKLTIIGSDNGLSTGRRQAIFWTNAGILLIRTLGTNLSEILSEIRTLSFKKMHFKMSFAKWRPLCLCLNVVIYKFQGKYFLTQFCRDYSMDISWNPFYTCDVITDTCPYVNGAYWYRP